jgi:hypothetical protein
MVGYTVYRFDLPACPTSAFALPDSVGELSNRFTAVRTGELMCPRSMFYEASGKTFFNVRLNRGQSCSLDVGYKYLTRSPLTEEDMRRYEKELGPSVDNLARLIIGNAGVTPPVGKPRVERFETAEELNTWCARTSADASQPCDRHGSESKQVAYAGARRIP